MYKISFDFKDNNNKIFKSCTHLNIKMLNSNVLTGIKDNTHES